MNFNDIKNKFLLLDSNVVINYSKFVIFYQELFNTLAEHNVNPVIDPFVRFEVLQIAENKKSREKIEEKLFSLFSDEELNMPPADSGLYKLATKISNLYQAKVDRSSKISTIDKFLAARMLSFARKDRNQDLFLATENHVDFPQELFERIGVYTIDRKDQIHNVGFYQVKEDALEIID